MQRRLSDFVAPDSLSFARRMKTDAQGQQTNSLEDALSIVDGLDLAQVHDSNTTHRHKGSHISFPHQCITQGVLCARGCGAFLNRRHLTLTALCFDVQLLETPSRPFRFFPALFYSYILFLGIAPAQIRTFRAIAPSAGQARPRGWPGGFWRGSIFSKL